MNNSMSDRKLEQGLWGVSWNASQEDLELAHPVVSGIDGRTLVLLISNTA